MSITFNPFSGNFDFVGRASAIYLPTVATESDLPLGDSDGAVRVVLSTDKVYVYDLPSLKWYDSGITPAAFSSVSNAAGVTLTQSAVGNIIKTNLVMHAADATNPGALTAVSQIIAGLKTFQATINTNAGIDVTSTAGTDTLSIGTNNADVINIGRAGATVNIQGTTLYENVTDLNVKDGTITLNKGGAIGSAAASGIELEEAGSPTGYVQTSNDRNSWQLKAPNTAGVVTITPGPSGIALNQSSHNPVTVGTANGLSLSTQALSLQLASSTQPGALSAIDWANFDQKVDSVNGLEGNVVLITDNVNEGATNLYYTAARFNVAFAGKTTSNLAEGTNLYYTQTRFDNALAAKTTTNLVEGTNLYYTSTRFTTDFSTKSTTNLSEGSNLYYTATRFDSAFAAKTTSNLTEGINLYYTTTRFNTDFSGRTTTNLVEGTNLYYTTVRFSTDFATKSTTNLTEGTNLYYTSTRFSADFAAKTTSNLTEGTNLYYTPARFDTAFATKSTTNLVEGTNLYYTAARFNAAFNPAFATKSTTDLAEGTNLYYTSARFTTDFATKTTTNLSEGTNLYYTSARFDTAFATKSTTNLAEGTNLYYTTARFNTDFSGRTTTNLAEGINLYYTTTRFNTDFAAKSTSNLVEGTNLYYTTARFSADFATKSTTNLTEGSNLYYTTTRFNADFAGRSTSNLVEGTNLYYTTTRFTTDFATKTTTNLVEGSNLYYTATRFDSALATKSTTNLSEGTNLYFTDERAQDATGAMVTNSSNITLTYNDPANTLTADLTASGAVAGTYGSTTQVAQVTVDIKGRVTSVANVNISGVSATDIADTTFSGAIAASLTNITGFTFANATVRSFMAQVSVVSAGAYEMFILRGIQKGASWELSASANGDTSGVTFDITSTGQVQYTSTGSVDMHFRADTLTV